MKTYKVVAAERALKDIRRITNYLMYDKMNPQAAKSVFDDFFQTAEKLSYIADILPVSYNSDLRTRGLIRMNFLHHNYFLLFRIRRDTAEITNVFHAKENYEKKV